MKILNHSDQKGYCNMEKKWANLGVPRNKLAHKKVTLNEKQTTIKAK